MKSKPTLGLVDYGMGNLNSVSKALELAGAKVKAVERVSDLRNCGGIVLPGVGAFSTAIRNLKKKALFEPVKDWIEEGKYFLGICLGYQMLFEKSEETLGGREKGLGIFKGTVRRFSAGTELKVPHMGWNQISVTKKSAEYSVNFRRVILLFCAPYFPDPIKRILPPAGRGTERILFPVFRAGTCSPVSSTRKKAETRALNC